VRECPLAFQKSTSEVSQVTGPVFDIREIKRSFVDVSSMHHHRVSHYESVRISVGGDSVPIVVCGLMMGAITAGLYFTGEIANAEVVAAVTGFFYTPIAAVFGLYSFFQLRNAKRMDAMNC
jgi:drug/metabolite transporter (DMT)-like permease